MILIDGSALTYKSFHGNVKDIIQDNEFNKDYFKHLLISTILWKAKLLGASKSNKVVICSDSKPYWRTEYFNSVKHEYFKDYYLTEKTKKDIDIENYTYKGKRAKMDPELSKNIWDVHTDVINFFNSFTDFHELKVKSAEADDVMAVLAKHYADLGEDVYLVGGDKDFKQLLSNPKIHFYNDSPFRKQGMSEWFECENPQDFLQLHILTGDVSDNIPNIKPKLGEKTAEKIIQNPELLEEMKKANPSINFRYEVNRKMICFDYIPEDLRKLILDSYEAIKDIDVYNESEIIDYLMGSGLNDLQGRRSEFKLKSFVVETKLNKYHSGGQKKKVSVEQVKKNEDLISTWMDDIFN